MTYKSPRNPQVLASDRQILLAYDWLTKVQKFRVQGLSKSTRSYLRLQGFRVTTALLSEMENRIHKTSMEARVLSSWLW